jgi:hypothetical protein
MSIRNKRLIKELQKISNIEINNDWENDKIVILKRQNITIEIDEKYPFSIPKLYINELNKKRINYIDWFLKERTKHKNILSELNINLICICCSTITCEWSPISGIKDILNEYDTYYNKYYIIQKFIIIYNKINNFDNLIYKHILYFLY